MVAVLDTAFGGGACHRQIAIGDADDSLAAGQSVGLDDVHGIGQDVIPVGTVRRHQRGGGHDLLQVVLGVHQQDHIPDLARLTVRISRHDGQQIAHGVGRQIVNLDGSLLGVCTAGNGDAVAYLADHTDGLLVAVAGDEACLHSVAQSLVEGLADETVQPLRTQLQHGLTDRQESGQLQQRGGYLLKTSGQLLDDVVAQLAPHGLLIAVGVHHDLDRAAGGAEFDAAQQGVRRLQLVKNGVDDGGGQRLIHAGDSLPGVGRAHGCGQLLVVAALLAGQLMDAALGKDAGIDFLPQVIKPLLVLGLDVQTDALHHLIQGGRERAGVAGDGSLLESLPQFLAGANVIVVHSFSPFDSQENSPRTLLIFSGLPPPWGSLLGAGTEGAAARSRSCAASDF